MPEPSWPLSSIHSRTLPIPPSCIEFAPGQREWLVIGTYFLESGGGEEEQRGNAEGEGQKRSGSLVLARLSEGEISFVSTTPTPFAIFDLHFSPHTTGSIKSTSSSSHLLGLATSTGSIALYAIDPHATVPASQVTHLRTLQLFPRTCLFTYFSWHPHIPLLVGAALADGRVVLCDCSGDDAETSRRVLTLHAHALEAWVTAFAPDGSALYSGGDDATLKGVGLPLPDSILPGVELSASKYLAALASKADDNDDQEEERRGADDDNDETDEGQGEEGLAFSPPWKWQDARTHGAGVTFILPLPISLPSNTTPSAIIPELPSDLLLTGSYDESLRLVAPPPPTVPRRARELADIGLDGGVWRICLIDGPTTTTKTDRESAIVCWTLLVSCMHAGTRVVQLTGKGDGDAEREGAWEWHFEVLARFEEHQSMNYGSVVQPLLQFERGMTGVVVEGQESAGETGRRTVVSTSFYDRLVAVWEWERT